jgi:hypothetical protein
LRETGVQEVMTSTSIDRHPTAFHQTGLPVLRGALDVGMMSDLLAPLIAPLGPVDGVRYAKLLAYKRGNRGLIRYEIDTADGPAVVVGKLYPDLARVQAVHERMAHLWEKVFAGSSTFGIPRPLGWVSDLSMLVYVPVEGQTLDEVVDEPDAAGHFARTATWLAALHTSAVPLAKRFDLATEAVHLQAWVGLIAHTYPDLQPEAARLAAGLRERAKGLKLADRSPLHKDFHYRHVVVDPAAGPALWVLDFDEMRSGDGTFDVAHFCANLDLLELRTPAPVAPLRTAFLEAYAERAGWAVDARFDWFHGYTCLKIAKQLCTVRGVRPRPSGAEQRRQTEAMLAQGLRSAGG